MELEGLDQEFELEAEAMPEGESGEVESAAEPASSKPVRVKPVINDEKNEKDALYWKLPSWRLSHTVHIEIWIHLWPLADSILQP